MLELESLQIIFFKIYLISIGDVYGSFFTGLHKSSIGLSSVIVYTTRISYHYI